MAGLNRIIFLVLGLVAIVIFFAVLTGRINLKGKLPTFSDGVRKEDTTPTPASPQSKKPASETKTNDDLPQNRPYKTTNKTSTTQKGLTTIPATGVPTVFLPITFFLLCAGLYLTRRN